MALHWATSFQYGIFRDELYYIEWSKRLAWGYVEQPPFIAFAIFLVRHVLGDSPFGLRFLPSLTGAAVVILTGLMAREMGGRRFAQILAAFCTAAGPIFLALHSMMTIDPFNQLFMIACLYILVRFFRTHDARLWLLFGLVAGVGLMNKLSMPFFGVGVVVALLLTGERRVFLHKEVWLGGLIAFLIFLPFLIWLAANQWATIEFMRNYGSGGKTWQSGFFEYLYMHVLTVNPLTAPIWLGGLYFLFRSSEGKPFRAIGVLFVVLYAMFFVLKAKFYFLSPMFTPLFAAGAVISERWLEAPERRKSLKPGYAAALIISGVILAPLAIPILPVQTLVKVLAPLGGTAGIKTEQLEETELPQHFADRFGWPEMVQRVADIYQTLSPEERSKCAIFASNYGEAAAIDFYGPGHGLPNALSGHGAYYLWGPGQFTGEVVIAILPESDATKLHEIFREVIPKGRNDVSPYAMPHERNKRFFLCRGITVPLKDVWPSLKRYG
ncbi:MAG: glycosyltransferase family 39 protein [Candidatus Hydrogenedentes bacterium]|nr:glycosyltransferase family 39 protein [Candidatus Hydrogenedentota bacterium]